MDGNRTHPEGGNTYGYIKFKTKATDEISIPYGEILEVQIQTVYHVL